MLSLAAARAVYTRMATQTSTHMSTLTEEHRCLCRYGLYIHSCGLHGYGLCTHGVYSYGVYCYGLYSYGLDSYGLYGYGR